MILIRFIIASIVACCSGFFGIIFFFADYGEGESIYSRMLLAVLYHFFFGAIVGALTSPFWKFAGVAAWGVVVFGLVGFLRGAAGGGDENLFEVLGVVFVPLIAAFLGGKVGSLILAKIRKKHEYS